MQRKNVTKGLEKPIFTDIDRWHTKKIEKTYNMKYLVEDDFKLLSDAFLVPIGPIHHHRDFNIRAHIFLCIIGMLFYRYLAWKCKNLHMSLKQLVEELEGIRIAIVKNSKGNKIKLVIEEMDAKQARLFSRLGLEKFIAD